MIFHFINIPHFHCPFIGHLGCFHFLPFGNTAAINTDEQVFLKMDKESFGPLFKVVYLDHVKELYPDFEGPPYLFPQYLNQFKLISAVNKFYTFVISMPAYVIICWFYLRCFDKGKMKSENNFNLNFPYD